MMLALVDGQRSYAHPHLDGRCELCGGIAIPKCGRINVWHWAHKSLQDCDTWSEPITAWHADWQSHFPADSCEIPIGSHRADVRSPTGLVIEFQHSALSVDEIHEREDHYGSMLWVFDAIEAFQTDRLNLRCKRPECNARYGVSGYGRYLKDPRHPCCINEDDDTSICCERPEGECVTRRWHQRRNMTTVWRRSPGRGWHRQWLNSDGPDKRPCCDTLTDGEADPYRSFRWKHPRRSLLHCRRPVFLDLGDGCPLELKKLYPNAPYGGWGYLCTVDAFLEALRPGVHVHLNHHPTKGNEMFDDLIAHTERGAMFIDHDGAPVVRIVGFDELVEVDADTAVRWLCPEDAQQLIQSIAESLDSE